MTILQAIARIVAVAVTIVGIAVAAPAQAAPSLGGSLSLDFGVAPPAGDDQMQFRKFGGDEDDEDDFWCYDLTNKQIRRGLRNAGFDDIDFVKNLNHDRVRVEALYEDDGWIYSMRIDRCDGEVDQIEPLYEAEDFDIDFDP
jgi:hypothetical protein